MNTRGIWALFLLLKINIIMANVIETETSHAGFIAVHVGRCSAIEEKM